LRNPAERAFSGYLMHVREGLRPLTTDEFIDPQSRYIRGGFYREKLARYLDAFPRESLHVVLFDELKRDSHSVLRGIHRFLGLDDVDFIADSGRRHNVGTYPRSYLLNSILTSHFVRHALAAVTPAPVRRFGQRLLEGNRGAPPKCPPELDRRLRELYRDDVMAVQEMLGVDLSTWLSSGESTGPRGA